MPSNEEIELGEDVMLGDEVIEVIGWSPFDSDIAIESHYHDYGFTRIELLDLVNAEDELTVKSE